jgi:signal transduction histidine kinase
MCDYGGANVQDDLLSRSPSGEPLGGGVTDQVSIEPGTPATSNAAEADVRMRRPATIRERVAVAWPLFPAWPSSRRSARRQERLIESLSEVAEAISSTKSIPEVLDTVVDEAKRLIDTDKAVLCLFDDDGGKLTVAEHSVFVRGRRDQYPEEWWRERIEGVARSAIEQRAPISSTSDGTCLMTVPVKTKGRAIGVLTVINPGERRFTQDQVALLAVLGAFAGSAIENARLNAESHYALLSDERGRIAKEMHDGLSQSLFSVSLELDVCRKRIRGDPAEVERRLGHMQTVLVRSLGELRRYIYDLRPVSLNTEGLVGAISQRTAEIGESRGLSVRIYTEGRERRVPPGVEACLYRVAQEAVSNVAKHAKAKRVVTMVEFRPTEVRLVIEDDGHGFDVVAALARCEQDECIGLRGMRERVESQGGRFTLSSGIRGTVVEATIPC